MPVLDFAHRVGIPSGMDAKSALLNILTERENDHVEWLNSFADRHGERSEVD